MSDRPGTNKAQADRPAAQSRGFRAGDGVVVRNKDARREYVLVAKRQAAISDYSRLGYKQEMRRPSGPYIYEHDSAGEGSAVEYMGHVLMSIDKADAERIRLEGHAESGALGQQYYDELEPKIVRQGGVDLMRGQMGRGIHLITETSGLHREG